MKIRWHYLLQVTSDQLSVKKYSYNNSFETILHEDVTYSVEVENITVGESRDILNKADIRFQKK